MLKREGHDRAGGASHAQQGTSTCRGGTCLWTGCLAWYACSSSGVKAMNATSPGLPASFTYMGDLPTTAASLSARPAHMQAGVALAIDLSHASRSGTRHKPVTCKPTPEPCELSSSMFACVCKPGDGEAFQALLPDEARASALKPTHEASRHQNMHPAPNFV